jgi:hypothetical protein
MDRDSVDPSIRQDHASLSNSLVDKGVSRDDTPDHEPEPEIECELNERPDICSIVDQRTRSHSPEPPPIARPAVDENHLGDVAGTFNPAIADISISLKFIECVQNTSLEDYLDEDSIYRILNPPEHKLDLNDPDDQYSIDVFLAVTTASEAMYNAIHSATLRQYPDSGMLTYHKVKQLVAYLSGVVPILTHMCINSCIGYTTDLTCCPMCGQGHYDAKKAPRKLFHTIPIGLQLQALWRTPEGADCMGYRRQYTEKIHEELQQHNGICVSPYRDFLTAVITWMLWQARISCPKTWSSCSLLTVPSCTITRHRIAGYIFG